MLFKQVSALHLKTFLSLPFFSVEGTPEDVRSILRTRAQRRKLQGQQVRMPLKAKPRKEQVTLSDVGDKQTSRREKTTNHSTETPVKQGKCNNFKVTPITVNSQCTWNEAL